MIPERKRSSSAESSNRLAFLFALGSCDLILLTIFNSRATSMAELGANFSSTELSNQEQMQFPEGLDYSRFQHNSQNHSRLPCLLCHRRESNSPIPKRPGGSGHLPCAGCHAQ